MHNTSCLLKYSWKGEKPEFEKLILNKHLAHWLKVYVVGKENARCLSVDNKMNKVCGT